VADFEKLYVDTGLTLRDADETRGWLKLAGDSRREKSMVTEHSSERLTYEEEPSSLDRAFVYLTIAGAVLVVSQIWDQVEGHGSVLAMLAIFCAGLWWFYRLLHVKTLAVFDRAAGTFRLERTRSGRLLHQLEHPLSAVERVELDSGPSASGTHVRLGVVIDGQRVLLSSGASCEQSLDAAMQIAAFVGLQVTGASAVSLASRASSAPGAGSN